MTRTVEFHVVVAVPLELNDDGTVASIGSPYVDENPFPVLEGETYVPDADTENGEPDWRESTEAEYTAGYDTVETALTFLGEALKADADAADN